MPWFPQPKKVPNPPDSTRGWIKAQKHRLPSETGDGSLQSLQATHFAEQMVGAVTLPVRSGNGQAGALTQAVLGGFAGSLPLPGVWGGLGGGRALEVVAGLVVLPGVALALAGRDHGDLVGARAAVLTLQLDSLRARLVVDTPPLLRAPAAPVLGAVAAPDPVGEHRQGQALASAHQLLQGADAGALAIRDVLGGTQFPTAHLNPSYRKRERERERAVIRHADKACKRLVFQSKLQERKSFLNSTDGGWTLALFSQGSHLLA